MKNQVFNPFLPLDVYIPDGEPHVFGDRIYLYGSHDKEGGDTFCELNYELWSAPVDDLTNWTCHGTIYSAKQDALYNSERKYIYAPDVVKGNDGRFYLYYGLSGYKGKGGYHGPISVAVCDTPCGNFEYLGYVKNRDGTPFDKFVCFDPAVINDDGVIRLYYGTSLPMGIYVPGILKVLMFPIIKSLYAKSLKDTIAKPSIFGANMVTLCDDMLTVNSEAVRIIPEKIIGTSFVGHGFFEGASIRKIEDTYYFIYSSQKNHELCYATSKYPDRDFTYGGTIVSNGDVGFNGRKEKDRLNATGTNHGSIEKINGKWYVFYHRLTHGSDYSRQACAEPIYFEDDGSIKQIEISSCGLNGKPLNVCGKYPAAIACNITNGKMPHISNRQFKKSIPMVTHKCNEKFISGITDETIVTYKWFDFNKLTGVISLDIESTDEGHINIIADNEIIASADIFGSGRRIITADYILPSLGVKTLTFKYTGNSKINLYSFEFGGN